MSRDDASPSPPGDLGAAAEELYGLLPEEFVARRRELVARARQAGDRGLAAAVSKLTRPTAGAWLVNQLVRTEADLVGEILALGDDLRAAQARLAADQLRELSARRTALVGRATQAVRDLATSLGRPVTAGTGQDVEATLQAALADPAAAEAVRSGRLTRTLAHAGLGPVELDGAVAAAAEPRSDPAAARAADRAAAVPAPPQGTTTDKASAASATSEGSKTSEGSAAPDALFTRPARRTAGTTDGKPRRKNRSGDDGASKNHDGRRPEKAAARPERPPPEDISDQPESEHHSAMTAARRVVDETTAAADLAARQHDERAADAARARARLDRLQARIVELTADLERARAEAGSAGSALAAAERRRAEADRAAQRAARRRDRARAELDRLEETAHRG